MYIGQTPCFGKSIWLKSLFNFELREGNKKWIFTTYPKNIERYIQLALN